MLDHAGRSLKWFVLSIFFVIGAWGVFHANLTGDIKYMGAVVFGWGIAYIKSLLIVKLNRETAIGSLIVWGMTCFLTQTAYVPTWVYSLTDYNLLQHNFFMVWLGMVFILGVPAMMKIFDKYD